MSQQSIMDAIREMGPMGCTELAEHLDLHRVTVGKSIRALRDYKKLYVSGYERQPGRGRGWYTVLYAIGNKADVPKPKGLTPTERSRVYRERNKVIIRLRRRARKTAATPWTGLGA
jgi:hypothetical protein